MARIRTIKPSFWTSVSVARLPKQTRLTYIGLWNYVDDEGRGRDNLDLIKAAIWPLDKDMNPRRIELDLKLLSETGRIVRYEVEDDRYLLIPNWRIHQRINRPQRSEIPAPFTDDSLNDHGVITEDAVNDQGTITDGSLRERKGKEGKGINPPNPPEEGLGEPPASGRPRDELFEALAEVCHLETASLTKNERGRLNDARKQLADVGATPGEVRLRAAMYRARFRNAELTPQALTNNWSTLRPQVQSGDGYHTSPTGRRVPNALIGRSSE